MKHLPLMTLSLVAVLSVGCSNPSLQEASAPTGPLQVKKRAQALAGVTLREVPVSGEVLAAAGGEAQVRAFQIELLEGASPSVEELVTAAFTVGASEPVNQPWQAGLERDREETRAALKFLDGLAPAIEAQAGTGEQYHSGYRYWFQQAEQDACSHGDFYGLVFKEAGRVFTIEATGSTAC